MFWSIPAQNYRPLLDVLKADIFAWNGSIWDGYSESLRAYLRANNIDPKVKYSHFYVQTRHTVAGSYTWRGTNLYRFADKADEACNASKRIWIDVLVVDQNSISASDLVIDTTDSIYDDCEVWVFLDDCYLDRAWCLAEACKFSNPDSKCVIIVTGKAEFKQGTDFFGCMQAGYEAGVLSRWG